MNEIKSVAVVGLGYVGLPLVVEFGKHIQSHGFDLNDEKIQSYQNKIDPNGQVTASEFDASVLTTYTSDPEVLGKVDAIIVAVPTPVDEACQPDFKSLIYASEIIAANMKDGCVVIYESTVYPGVTEEICIPKLEEHSGKTWKKDFFVGYSPERINPGDRIRTLTNIIKVVSGDSEETLKRVAELYEMIVEAGVHRAESIKIAEASKVIENTQRDVNIALMNELAIIFDKASIDTTKVLKAAGTKWNFMTFSPGLVGGHCIGVDPYYLTYKAQVLGYQPRIILASRQLNDSIGKYIAQQTIQSIIAAGGYVKGANVSIFGITFKEDCPDIRNSKVIDIIRELERYNVKANVHDPHACEHEVKKGYGIRLHSMDELPKADAVILAVKHGCFDSITASDWMDKVVDQGCFIDVKSFLPEQELNKAGHSVWRL